MKLNTSNIIKTIALGALLIIGSQATASAQQVGTPTVERFGTRIYDKNGLITIRADIQENQRLLQASRSKEFKHNVTEFSYLYWGAPRTAKELQKYRPLATELKTTPEALFLEFTARANYYFLTFNDFLVAKVIASNLEATRPDITSDVLLDGLRNRKSFTRTMRNMGLTLEESKAIEQAARLEIKESLR